ncbi:MAG: hypothetical protein IKG81_04395 [Bacteroidales bacterium]|nr:hypothetical protein [Bacteroidales bacterium]
MSIRHKIRIYVLSVVLSFLGLQSCDKCECEPCDNNRVDTMPESALTVTYSTTKDLIDGVSPVVRLRVNGVETQQTLSLTDFAEADSTWMEYVQKIPVEGDSNRLEMVITYVKNDSLPTKGSFTLGRKITAQCRGIKTNQSSTAVNGVGQQSYAAALDVIAASGKDSLVLSQDRRGVTIDAFVQ